VLFLFEQGSDSQNLTVLRAVAAGTSQPLFLRSKNEARRSPSIASYERKPFFELFIEKTRLQFYNQAKLLKEVAFVFQILEHF